MTEYTNLISISAAITALGGAWLTVRKIAKDVHKSKDEHAAYIIQQAKEEDALIKVKLESKIESLRSELRALEHSVNKDLGHIKETHENEIRSLGEKIEALRDELRQNHASTVSLLGKLIDKA